ncbi:MULTISPECIES: type II toxin-antitoxin system HipA family toxin [Kordiimonas]|jgi:serine/threonine-protein kinase HipA|uniref:type II toxin-antitoxin system HipA family toxin n=1 Tax=Kordiimonas TaxID=288021 RepID=UPI00257A1B91|nr:type II toxin-antitoxin system HipA family toxin [Kordiimonas sp. UBA4487]
MTTATVKLWGTTIGYVSMDKGERFARFEYDPDFARLGIELAPLTMPLKARRIYRFPELEPRTFHGLPGLLSDSLPDKYGNRLINIWLARTGRKAEEFNAVDRLCYTGRRGMGALEFEPSLSETTATDKKLEVKELVELASMAFASKETLDTRFTEERGEDALLDILSVGTSAGGARAKAVIAFHPDTREVRSGQLDLPPGFEHWLIKFDGVEFNGDWGVADPAGYGLLEYSYYQTALDCDITMMESRLFPENGRNHFMTRRFDRESDGRKKFVQTLGAIAHFDYWDSGQHSYEQVFMIMKQLGMPQVAIEEQYRRTVFNIVGCNQDDHVKNISFIMDRQGKWDLSPAYDMCHAEGSDFTRFHQMSVNGKTTGFTRDDLKHLADYAGLPRGRDRHILEKTVQSFNRWEKRAEELAIPAPLKSHVLKTLRLDW